MSASIVLADHSLRIKPKTFSAASGENWLVWLRKFKNIASLNKWKAELQRQILYLVVVVVNLYLNSVKKSSVILIVF